jgi:iron(III) transport system substrate-binding protein
MVRGIVTRLGLVGLALVGLLPAAGCGGQGESADGITVYSGRAEELVGPLIDEFTSETGIEVAVRYGDSAELAATIAEEGDRSPADVFFAQDAGSLGAVAGEGLLATLPRRMLDRVPARFRDPGGRWVGTSGRVRVVGYNTDRLSEDELPDSIWDYAGREWRDRVGIAPTNASFQATVSAMMLTAGVDRTRAWLEALGDNGARLYENNLQALEAVAAGEIEVALVNHYYLYELRAEQPDAPVANHFLAPGDAGALVNVAGAGILAATNKPARAERFVEYLLRRDAGQRFFAEHTAEYPLVAGIRPGEDLPPLSALQGPDLPLGELGPELERTLELLNEVGLTS